ncbi:hypothetical protein AAG570_006505 [Ranatra chinensis]|uniref:SEP domain-containing protein n=1 Tax=Ranatra chinensis TaxID=642074 RepID=A0ABD0Z6Z5_9HEMI
MVTLSNQTEGGSDTADKLLKKKEDCIIPLLVRKIYAAEDKLQFLQQQLHEAFKISKKMDEERTEIVAKSLPNRSPPTSTGFLETLKDIVNSQVVKQITSDEEITDSMILKYMEKQLKKADKEKKPAKACIKDNDRKKICITEIETENGTSQIHICQKEPEESDEIFHEIMSNESVGGTKKKYNIIKEALIARRKSNNAEFVSIMTAIREKDLTDEEKYNINQRLAVLAEEYKQLTTRMLHLEGAKYEKNDFLALTLYENGMALDDLSFREYSSLSAREFFYDLGDGYYPTELKSQYPDGVIFKKPFSKHYAGGEHLKRKITYDIRKSDSVLEDELVDYSLSNAKG